MKLNFTKAGINANVGKSNNIEFYVDLLHLFSRGLLWIVFMHNLICNKEAVCNLLSKLRSHILIPVTHTSQIECITGIICMLSIIGSFLTAIMGLDTVHFYIVKTSGWSFRDVVLQHEFNIINAFTKMRIWNQNVTEHVLKSPIANAGDWTPLEVILGGFGISSSFCALLLDSAVSDLLLSSSAMLYWIVKEMRLDEGCTKTNMNLAETQTTFKGIVKRFECVMDISEAMNEAVGGLVPFLISVNVLVVVSMLNLTLDNNWSAVSIHAFKLIKDSAAIYLANNIAAEV